MNESLEVIVEVIAIVSFVATILNYTIIKPLKVSIDTLALAVNKLEKLLHKVEEDEQKLRERVITNETKISQIQNDVDTLKQYHQQPINGGKHS